MTAFKEAAVSHSNYNERLKHIWIGKVVEYKEVYYYVVDVTANGELVISTDGTASTLTIKVRDAKVVK